jgi:hypothetical protein
VLVLRRFGRLSNWVSGTVLVCDLSLCARLGVSSQLGSRQAAWRAENQQLIHDDSVCGAALAARAVERAQDDRLTPQRLITKEEFVAALNAGIRLAEWRLEQWSIQGGRTGENRTGWRWVARYVK